MPGLAAPALAGSSRSARKLPQSRDNFFSPQDRQRVLDQVFRRAHRPCPGPTRHWWQGDLVQLLCDKTVSPRRSPAVPDCTADTVQGNTNSWDSPVPDARQASTRSRYLSPRRSVQSRLGFRKRRSRGPKERKRERSVLERSSQRGAGSSHVTLPSPLRGCKRKEEALA